VNPPIVWRRTVVVCPRCGVRGEPMPGVVDESALCFDCWRRAERDSNT
jgi:DNA-directed RNA polymerase subunit RPC12/RpoP